MDAQSINNEGSVSATTDVKVVEVKVANEEKHVDQSTEEPIAKLDAPPAIVMESAADSAPNEVQAMPLDIPLETTADFASGKVPTEEKQHESPMEAQIVVETVVKEAENETASLESQTEADESANHTIQAEETPVEATKDIPAESPSECAELVDVSPKVVKVVETPEHTEAVQENTEKSTEPPQIIEVMDTENQETPLHKTASTGLGLLSQYDSDAITDSEEDGDVVEVPATTTVTHYRNKVIEVKSDSSSDDDSSDSDVEYLNEIRKAIDKRIGPHEDDDEDNDVDDDDDDGDGGKRKQKRQPPKVRGEQTLDDLPPIHELQITVPEEECVQLGKIQSIVDQLVLVSVLPNAVLLDLDTVLFLDKGKRVLGEVFDVLGQVSDPLYCVRFNTNAQIKEKGIQVGDIVYMAPKTQYTQFVILSNLMKIRGSDASWEHDVEPPPRFLDYSDDEEEREARSALRNKNRPTDHEEAPKRSRNERDTSAGPSHANRPAHRRGGGDHGAGYQQRPPAYAQNHNRSSWHSNYYPHPHQQQQHQQPYHGGYHGGAAVPPYAQAPSYQMPPQQYPQQYHQPPPYAYQGLPQFEGRYPYGGRAQQAPPHTDDAPMYVPNPYAMRAPVLPNQTPPMYPPPQMPPGGGH